MVVELSGDVVLTVWRDRTTIQVLSQDNSYLDRDLKHVQCRIGNQLDVT